MLCYDYNHHISIISDNVDHVCHNGATITIIVIIVYWLWIFVFLI